jgi:DHA3 family macrolide efflux protein-like MFS transporter
MFGSSVVAYAIIWYVTLKTGSGGQYSLLLIASQLSMAATMIPGGVWADRYWRKALMIGADAVVALATIALAVFMLNGFENLWMIAGALVIRGLGGGIQHPAANAALPQISPADKLMRINSIFQSIQSLVFIAAPALAAVMLVYIPLGWILMVDVVTAVLGIGCTLAVRIPRLEADPDQPPPEGLKGYVSHIGEAVKHAAAIPGLRRIALLGVVILVIVIPFAQMTPVFVVRLFGDAQWMLAAVEMVWSIGMIVGGLAIAAWGGFKNRMTMIMLSCVLISAMTMVMGFAPNIWMFLIVMVVSGLAMPMWNTPSMTAIQELIPPTMMGRVISFYGLISSLGAPIGMAIIGPLSDQLDISWMALVCGGVGLAILIILALRGGPGSRLYAPEGAGTPLEAASPSDAGPL